MPLLGIAVCLAMMIGLPGETWPQLLVWLAIGLLVYFSYGRRQSTLRREAVAAGNTANSR